METLLIAGLTSDTKARTLLVDSSGRPVVRVDEGELVVQPPFGGLWLAPDAPYAERIENTNLDAGTNTITLTVCPEGYFRKITGCAIYYLGTIATVRLAIDLCINGVLSRVYTNQTPASGTFYALTVDGLLAAGDYVQGICVNATAGDDMIVSAYGHNIPIS